MHFVCPETGCSCSDEKLNTEYKLIDDSAASLKSPGGGAVISSQTGLWTLWSLLASLNYYTWWVQYLCFLYFYLCNFKMYMCTVVSDVMIGNGLWIPLSPLLSSVFVHFEDTTVSKRWSVCIIRECRSISVVQFLFFPLNLTLIQCTSSNMTKLHASPRDSSLIC